MTFSGPSLDAPSTATQAKPGDIAPSRAAARKAASKGGSGKTAGQSTMAPKAPKRVPVVKAPSSGVTYPGTSRNAPCPCGSGKKYKLCHGKDET
jgi:preprotein translocase subunit SecA